MFSPDGFELNLFVLSKYFRISELRTKVLIHVVRTGSTNVLSKVRKYFRTKVPSYFRTSVKVRKYFRTFVQYVYTYNNASFRKYLSSSMYLPSYTAADTSCWTNVRNTNVRLFKQYS